MWPGPVSMQARAKSWHLQHRDWNRYHTIDLYTEVIRALRSKGKTIPNRFDKPKRDMARPGDIKVSTLDASKAKKELKWQPNYDLHEGLVETVDWYINL